MARKQRIAVLIGTCLVVLSGLYPPYVGTFAQEGDNWRRFVGYHLFFLPPTPEQVCKIVVGERMNNERARLYAQHCWSSIDVARFGVQVVVILLATVGVVFLIGGTKP